MATRHSNLGSVLTDLDDPAGARTHIEQALKITQAALGPDHPNTVAVRRNIEDVLQRLGST